MKLLQQICRVSTLSLIKGTRLLPVSSVCDKRIRNYGYAAVNPYQAIREPMTKLPKFTPDAVNEILQKNQIQVGFKTESSVVTGYCSNQLAANVPIEDKRSEAQCLLTDGLMFGVFDGHSGPACAQTISERLFDYIATEILPYETLLSVFKKVENQEINLVKWLGGGSRGVSPNAKLHHNSLVKYLHENVSMDIEAEDDIAELLTIAFDRLDNDLKTEALSHSTDQVVNEESLHSVFSGSCANVAFIQGKKLFVANSGDCRAVMGTQMDNGMWSPIVLSNDHNAHNRNEVNRVKSGHPANEGMTVIRQERLLAELIPLRAFGDARFKWKADDQKDTLRKWNKHVMLPRHFYTPPYLTATPEITHYDLDGKAGFVILATDGLWDCLDPDKAVALVGAHWEAMGQMGPYKPASKVTLGQIQGILAQRQFSLRPLDSNVATHLIRYALCGVGHTFDYNKLATSVSLPANVVRHHRDDITVTVIFFNGME